MSVEILVIKFREYILSLINGIPFLLWLLLILLSLIGFVIAYNKHKWIPFFRFLLLEYIILIFSSTVFFRPVHSVRLYNIIPFDNIGAIIYGTDSTQITEKVMNLVVFIPLGVLSKIVFQQKKWWIILMVGGLISFSVELFQYLLKRGHAEMNDIIYNTMGCMIGYGICSLIIIVGRRFHKVEL